MDLHWSPLERLGQVFSVRHAISAIGSKSVIVTVIDFSGTLVLLRNLDGEKEQDS
jgi:hypothetical protein